MKKKVVKEKTAKKTFIVPKNRLDCRAAGVPAQGTAAPLDDFTHSDLYSLQEIALTTTLEPAERLRNFPY